MKWMLALAAGTLLGAVAVALSQPEGNGPGGDPAKAMKKQVATMMAQQSAPAEEHKLLESFIGDSDVEVRINLGPGMPPLSAKGKGTGKWVLGNRFVEVVSEPAPDEDLKISHISYYGYDKRKKKYFWWGIDNTDTYSVFAEGDYDAATKTFTLKGENLEPELGGTVPFKQVIVAGENGERTMTIWMQHKGAPGADDEGWFQVMETRISKRR